MICLHGPQSFDTPVGCDRDKLSKSKPVSTCGHMVIYTEFTLLPFDRYEPNRTDTNIKQTLKNTNGRHES